MLKEPICIPPGLPLPEYATLKYALEMDPPGIPELKHAVDLYLMTVSYLGGPAWSDKVLGEALAWSWAAGFPEVCALSKALNTVILLATYRFGMRGGCIPDMRLLSAHVRKPFTSLIKDDGDREWLVPFGERFNIKRITKINYKEWTAGPNFMHLMKVWKIAGIRRR